MYGIIDCDNCYVSCERVFRPDLKGKPVVVLSNNDGCVVARSEEAKRLGIKAGTPYYQLADQFPPEVYRDIVVFSSNYELYGELTARVVELIRQEAPAFFRYSIDECFVYFNTDHSSPSSVVNSPLPATVNLKQWGENLHKRILKSVGLPVSIGLAPNKTLAKMASHFAKKYKGYRHCCLIDTDEKRQKALSLYPIGEVWGIGRRYARKSESLGIHTAYDLASQSLGWVRLTFNNINMERTWRELNGQDCIPNEVLAKKQSICTSRSFNGMTSDLETLRTHVANYAARCAEKLRRQHSVASVVAVFLHTNSFLDDLPQYWNFEQRRLLTPTSSTLTIVQTAHEVLQQIYRPDYRYKKAGVILLDIVPEKPLQPDLFDSNARKYAKLQRLDLAIDHINKINGTETLLIGSQQYVRRLCEQRQSKQIETDKFASAMRQEHKSKNPTTRWSDIIHLK